MKTASPGEIVARVKAVLRRTSSPAQTTVESLLENGHLQLNLVSREVFVEGNKVMFTPKEYELLLLFTQHPKQVFTYDQLLDKYWAGIGDRHTVRVHVSRLREKIEIDPANPQYLVNVWGVGYRYEGGSHENVKDS
ncbi:Sensory transduction protein regX3 [compost metagenome]